MARKESNLGDGCALLHRSHADRLQDSKPITLLWIEVVGVAQAKHGTDIILAAGLVISVREQYHDVQRAWLEWRVGNA